MNLSISWSTQNICWYQLHFWIFSAFLCSMPSLSVKLVLEITLLQDLPIPVRSWVGYLRLCALLFLHLQRGTVLKKSNNKIIKLSKFGWRYSAVNLRCDGDEKHVARLEYDVTGIACPDTAGECHQKHSTRPHGWEQPQRQLSPHGPGHLDVAHSEGCCSTWPVEGKDEVINLSFQRTTLPLGLCILVVIHSLILTTRLSLNIGIKVDVASKQNLMHTHAFAGFHITCPLWWTTSTRLESTISNNQRIHFLLTLSP